MDTVIKSILEMLTTDNPFLVIATIGKTYKFLGELKIHFSTDFLEQFKQQSVFYIKSNEPIEIESIDLDKKLVKFVGFNNKESAQILVNQPLKTTIALTQKHCTLKEDEFFWFDVIGCNVFEDGEILGQIKEIQRLAITDYLVVQTDKKYKNLPKTFMIPYIDAYILHTDIENKKVNTQNAYNILENS